MKACSGCGRPTLVVYEAEHKRKDEKQAGVWAIGKCCWSDATVAEDAKAMTKGRM